MKEKKSILFLCTGNSCRSQMAEGWTRFLRGDEFDVYSAGIEKHGLNPFAVKVMAEEGIDILAQSSQLISELPISDFDYVVTVCSNADQRCPYFPAQTKKIHNGFGDPPKLAAGVENEDEVLNIYRQVSREIKEFVENLATFF